MIFFLMSIGSALTTIKFSAFRQGTSINIMCPINCSLATNARYFTLAYGETNAFMEITLLLKIREMLIYTY